MYHRKLIGQPDVVTPHWFDDSFKSQRLQSVAHYAWPDPPVFKSGPLLSLASGAGYEDNLGERLNDAARAVFGTPKSARIDRDRERHASLVWKSVEQEASGSLLLNSSSGQSSVWAGRKILLSNSLDIESGTREALETTIKRGGGVLYDPSSEIEDFDVLVTMHSRGEDYVKVTKLLSSYICDSYILLQAKAAQKLIGTIAWVFYVGAAERISAPEDQLLHYPTSKDFIPEFVGFVG